VRNLQVNGYTVALSRSKAGGDRAWGTGMESRVGKEAWHIPTCCREAGHADQAGGRRSEIRALDEQQHVTLNDIRRSRPKFETSSEGTASPLIPPPP